MNPMKQTRSRHITLSSRDQLVIRHVDRMRISTIEMLMCSALMGLSRSAISKIVNRLCRAGYLGSYTLHHPARYFVLGSEGAGFLGRKNHRTLPLGPQALAIEFATAAHCLLGNDKRKRLTREDIARHLPWLPERKQHIPMCFELSKKTLEIIRVDLGGSPAHVAGKCHFDIAERIDIPEFRGLVKSGDIRLVVVTSTAEKASAIRNATEKHEWPPGLQFHCSIVSNLITLLARTKNA